MSKLRQFTVEDLAKACNGQLADPGLTSKRIISRVAPIHDAGPDAITYISAEKHAEALATTNAAAVIGTARLLGNDPRSILVDDPELAMALVLDQFYLPPAKPAIGVHPSAIVDDTATLGDGVAVGACAVIRAGVRIGDNAVIHEGVSLGGDVQVGGRSVIHACCVIYDRCEVGSDVTIHAGAIIGADGFGYIFRDGQHRKIKHIGTVIIEDEVEIGANACIDRGKFGVTRIGTGSKIDNLVQIAHNVQVGPLCIITAQCGLSGSSRVGQGVVMGGQSGASDGAVIGDGARLASRAVAWVTVPAGMTVSGFPARDHKIELREQSRVRKLPKLFQRVTKLEKRIAELEAAADDPKHG